MGKLLLALTLVLGVCGGAHAADSPLVLMGGESYTDPMTSWEVVTVGRDGLFHWNDSISTQERTQSVFAA